MRHMGVTTGDTVTLFGARVGAGEVTRQNWGSTRRQLGRLIVVRTPWLNLL